MKARRSQKRNSTGALLEKAIRIAVEAHAAQKDKSGRPYILHPLRVMLRGATDEEMIVGILHDVVEDTPWTLAALRKEGFSKQVLQALDCLTKRENEDYQDSIRRLSVDRLARRVKIADLEDNMDARRLAEFTGKDGARFAKYVKAWQQLTEIENGSRRG